jgi:hypothetical protein
MGMRGIVQCKGDDTRFSGCPVEGGIQILDGSFQSTGRFCAVHSRAVPKFGKAPNSRRVQVRPSRTWLAQSRQLCRWVPSFFRVCLSDSTGSDTRGNGRRSSGDVRRWSNRVVCSWNNRTLSKAKLTAQGSIGSTRVSGTQSSEQSRILNPPNTSGTELPSAKADGVSNVE